jgi:hypothetical protein
MHVMCYSTGSTCLPTSHCQAGKSAYCSLLPPCYRTISILVATTQWLAPTTLPRVVVHVDVILIPIACHTSTAAPLCKPMHRVVVVSCIKQRHQLRAAEAWQGQCTLKQHV